MKMEPPPVFQWRHDALRDQLVQRPRRAGCAGTVYGTGPGFQYTAQRLALSPIHAGEVGAQKACSRNAHTLTVVLQPRKNTTMG